MSTTDLYDPVRAARRRFGGEMRRLRMDAKLTQEAIAVALGGGDSTVSDLERGVGTRPPDEDIVEGYIERCLGVLDATAAVRDERRRSLLDQFANVVRLIEYDQENRRRLRSESSRLRVMDSLPRDVPQLVGRDRELRILDQSGQLAGSGPVPVHVIEGMPGVGKTALAVHAARRLADRFPDGRLFVPLHAHTPGQAGADPADALATLLALDGLTTGVPRGVEARTAVWRNRTADRRLIMVFDDAGSFQQIEPLLPGSPASLVLITSRHRLGVANSVSIELATLPGPAATELMTALAGHRLADAEERDNVVGRCGGLPLAIGIVAGWLQAHPNIPVGELLADIDAAAQRLPGLRHGQRTIAAAFDVSYRGLPEDRQAFFRALGQNPGQDVDAYAAAALAGVTASQARAHLEALHDEHLVDQSRMGRFQLHDLVAGYAADLSHDALAARAEKDRLVTYYQASSAYANGWLSPHSEAGCTVERPSVGLELRELAGREDAVAWLRTEFENVTACIHECSRDHQSAPAFSLVDAYTEFLRRYGPWDRAAELIDLTVQLADAARDWPRRAHALLELGRMQRFADDNASAVQTLTAAVREFSTLGDNDAIVRARSALGETLWLTGDYAGAETHLAGALDQAQQTGGPDVRTTALIELGRFRMMTDQYDQAIALLQEAVEAAETTGDKAALARALRTLGFTYYLCDRYLESQVATQRALALAAELADPIGRAQGLVNIGGVLRLTGNYEPAEEALREAIALLHDMHKSSSEAQAMSELGALLGSTGRADEGERMLRTAATMCESIDDRLGLPAALNQLGEVLRLLGKLDEARAVLATTEQLYIGLDDQLGQAAAANVDGAVLLDLDRPSDARERYEVALRQAKVIGNPLEEAIAHEGLGRCALALGESTGWESLRRALAIFSGIGAAEAHRVAERLRDGPADR